MAFFDQQRATTRRKIRPNRVAMINARTPYIHDMMAAKDAKAHQGAMQGLAEKNFLLDYKAGHEGRKDQNRATNVAGGKTLLGMYLQNQENRGINEVLDASPQISNAEIGTQGNVAEGFDVDAYGNTGPEKSIGSKVWESGSKGLKEFGNKLTGKGVMSGGAIGGLASNLYKGKNKWSKAAVGAGVGAASQWAISGGLENLITGAGAATDWYSTALAGGLGGVLSFL